MTIESLNTFPTLDGILISPTEKEDAIYLLKPMQHYNDPMVASWELINHISCCRIATFRSRLAAEYRALSDFIERQTD